MKPETKKALDDYIDSCPNPSDEPYSFRTNQWISTEELHLYLRVGLHLIGGQMHRVIDLANITVHHPGQGLFTEVLEYLQKNTPYEGVYVENILNERLFEHIRKLQKKDSHWIQRGDNFAWLKVHDSERATTVKG
jgi:hypothetical protein